MLDQRVGERVAARRLSLREHRRVNCFVAQSKHVVLVALRDPSQHLNIELSPDHRGERQHLLRRRTEARDAPTDYLPDADRQARRPQIRALGPQPLFVLIDGTYLDEVSKQLTDKERISVGLFRKRVAQGNPVFGRRVLDRRFEQREKLVVAEAAQREPLDPRLAMQRRERFRERAIGADVGIAECADHEQSKGRVRGDDMTQKLNRGPVSPLEIVDDEHDRGNRGDARQDVDDRTKEQVPFRFRAAGWSPRVRCKAVEGRREPARARGRVRQRERRANRRVRERPDGRALRAKAGTGSRDPRRFGRTTRPRRSGTLPARTPPPTTSCRSRARRRARQPVVRPPQRRATTRSTPPVHEPALRTLRRMPPRLELGRESRVPRSRWRRVSRARDRRRAPRLRAGGAPGPARDPDRRRARRAPSGRHARHRPDGPNGRAPTSTRPTSSRAKDAGSRVPRAHRRAQCAGRARGPRRCVSRASKGAARQAGPPRPQPIHHHDSRPMRHRATAPTPRRVPRRARAASPAKSALRPACARLSKSVTSIEPAGIRRT